MKPCRGFSTVKGWLPWPEPLPSHVHSHGDYISQRGHYAGADTNPLSAGDLEKWPANVGKLQCLLDEVLRLI